MGGIFSLVVLLFTAVFPLQLFKGHAGLVRCISVEPQGQWMASGKWFSHCQKTQSPSSTVMEVECTGGVECRNTHTHTQQNHIDCTLDGVGTINIVGSHDLMTFDVVCWLQCYKPHHS